MKLIKVAILTLFISQIAAAEIDVSLANGTEKEELKREQIFRLIEHYDLKKWWFTDKIIIDESARSPFSKLNKTGMFVSQIPCLTKLNDACFILEPLFFTRFYVVRT